MRGAAGPIVVLLLLGGAPPVAAGWLPVGDLKVTREESELGGGRLTIEYRLEAEGITAEELEAVNARMSTYLPDSELSRFNRHSDPTPFALSPETFEVLELEPRPKQTDAAGENSP